MAECVGPSTHHSEYGLASVWHRAIQSLVKPILKYILYFIFYIYEGYFSNPSEPRASEQQARLTKISEREAQTRFSPKPFRDLKYEIAGVLSS